MSVLNALYLQLKAVCHCIMKQTKNRETWRAALWIGGRVSDEKTGLVLGWHGAHAAALRWCRRYIVDISQPQQKPVLRYRQRQFLISPKFPKIQHLAIINYITFHGSILWHEIKEHFFFIQVEIEPYNICD